jgi:hypothetical protein
MEPDSTHCLFCGTHLPVSWPPLCPVCLLAAAVVPYTEWPALEPPRG